jgi:hypothetical protein
MLRLVINIEPLAQQKAWIWNLIRWLYRFYY